MIDIDKRHGGFETLAKLRRAGKKLTPTVYYRTGGGGRHYLYRVPAGVHLRSVANALGRGIDIRADDGMAIIPFSSHASGNRYSLIEGHGPDEIQIDDMPKWMLHDLAIMERKAAPNLDVGSTTIPDGARNVVLARFAGLARNIGMGVDGIVQVLRGINRTACVPPLADRGVVAIAKSIARYPAGSLLSTAEASPFPIHALPKALAGFIRGAAKAMGCDVAMFAPHVFAVAGAAIGNTRRIRLKNSWTEPAIVWAVVVAESGTLKSPAHEKMTDPIRDRQTLARLKYEAEHQKWETDADKSSRGPAPRMTRYLTGEPTVEALMPILRDSPRGLLLVRDELSGWFGRLDAYKSAKGGDESVWLEVYGARQVVIDRRTSDTPVIIVDSPHVSICGTIQPAMLRRHLGRERRESGLSARFLLAMPPRRSKKWTDVDIAHKDKKHYCDGIDRLFTLLPKTVSGGTYMPRILPLSAPAMKAWIKFYDAHNAEAAALSGDLAAAWSKLEGYAARLALIIEHLHWAFGPAGKRPPVEVTYRSMKAAVELTRWFANEARRVYAILDADEEMENLHAVIEKLKSHGKPITVREFSRANKSLGSTAKVVALFDKLADAGLGEWRARKPGKKGGKPTRELVLKLED